MSLSAIYTPWGCAEHSEELIPGVTSHSTPSHGGMELSPERHAAVCAKFPRFRTFAGGRWYEEDCDWAVVVLAFAGEFDRETVERAETLVGGMQEFSQSPRWRHVYDSYLFGNRTEDVL